ncbi:MAG: hypothetical protein KatS3mg033_1925 [Thermonema sp.]|nr:MAG: hypothetical protein KatS3mg033_1925 [Thermonema sp.]
MRKKHFLFQYSYFYYFNSGGILYLFYRYTERLYPIINADTPHTQKSPGECTLNLQDINKAAHCSTGGLPGLHPKATVTFLA